MSACVDVGVRYCVEHNGIANEDQEHCDFADAGPCLFRQLYYRDNAPDVSHELLTPIEHDALTLSGQLAAKIALIVVPGPTAEQDIAELHHHLHVVQRYIGSQAAARAYPDRFRLLGGALKVDGE